MGFFYVVFVLYVVNRYFDFFCGIVLLGVRRILDGVNGFFVIVYWSR